MKKLLFILLILTGCATQALVNQTVPLTPELTLTMPKFDELKRDVKVSQLVTAHYKDQVFTFEGHVSANKDRFLMIGLDGLGRRAISITWTKTGIKYDSASFVPAQLKPENILADIVILYWPESSVRKAIGVNGKLVTGKNKRSIYVNNKEIIHAEYQPIGTDLWSGEVHYKNLQWNYSLDIQSVAAQ